MLNSTLTDRELVAAFEACTLSDFRHADHVRVAWLYLTLLPFPEASRRMAESVRRFAASKGATEKYHETITQAWMRLVVAAMKKDRNSGWRDPARRELRGKTTSSDFETFSAAHAELLDSHALDKFYSPELLATSLARAEFVPPDLSPLP
jgi:hypothetical protein